MMPKKLRPSELLDVGIEEPTFNSKQLSSHQGSNHNNTAGIPQIVLYLVSKSGSANMPE
ncbi:MAG: hypothetical protein ACI9EK_001231 [Psychroserpens sp.]|jgi:hypothetical protein